MPVILIENGARKGCRIPLTAQGPFAIGREQGTEIQLPDPMVSRRHCTIDLRDGTYFLHDLGSANGTLLNGERAGDAKLAPGDRILAGDTLLTFLNEDAGDPLVGKKLKGYGILERIGRGGMGTVYRARQVSLDRIVALKVLSPEMVEDPTFVGRFLDEARAAARLSHPNIVMVYDIDDDVMDGQRIVYYSMEYMAGGSVEDLLNRLGRLAPEAALGIALETARGLQYAEQVGLVHRDIKPGNLMVHENGTIKIGDLGIATHATRSRDPSAPRAGVSGSPHYISPEQARGHDIDSRADIYSLGASLFQMVAGRTPFVGANVKELLLKQLREPAPDLVALVPGLSPRVAALVARMLEKNRDLRPANAAQLIAAIESTLAELRAPPPAPRRFPLPSPRKMAAGAAVILALAGVLGGGTFAIVKYRQYRAGRAAIEEGLRDGVDGVRSALAAGKVEDAKARFEELRVAPALAQFPAISAEVDTLRYEVASARQLQDEARRRTQSDAELARLRAEAPDLAKASSAAQLEALIAPLEALVRSAAGLPAAKGAQDDLARVRSAIRALELRNRAGEAALRSLLITTSTFLDSKPPRYREALETLRAPPAEVRGTPSEKALANEVASVTARMARETEGWVREAETAAAAGQPEEAAARLEKLRDRVDGKALSALDAAIAKLRAPAEKTEAKADS